ncbi:hypothetical protein M0R89_06895 [Halorussus limi]|uniref:Uncharacterized protein n=1 Tax=Halorussus limi TaxID=2938695 RepID=A0A8U0HY65_9EURY|nr:hypothetical protein [Halorussus limi]UPV75779.1 hypothetical protein M0R89_06895 [Halorussus limi]
MDEDVLATCGGAVVLAAFGLLAAGPLGMAFVGGFLLVLSIALSGAEEANDETPTRNCPDCGAVVDGESCDYCGRSLSA